MRGQTVPIIPQGKWLPTRAGLNQLINQSNMFGASAGFGMSSTPMGLVGLPPDRDEIEVIVKDTELGSGGGGSAGDMPVWFHAFWQIRYPEDFLTQGVVEEDPLGIFGFPTMNPLINLNQLTIPAGTIVRAYRGPGMLCWLCYWDGNGGAAGSGSGGGGNNGTIQCPNGTIISYSFNGNNVVLT